ncbi:MAG: uroporphyrinogen-III synthase [bacterium]|nr:MAG: uroporphyrinogen-III synthase [bacterium]
MQPVERASKLRKALENSDVRFFNMPMIRIETVELNTEIQSAFDRLKNFDLLIFTSRNGVKAFFKLLDQAGLTFPEKMKIAAIGKGTAEEIRQYGREADYIQPGQTSRDFAAWLKDKVLTGGEKILMALGNLASDFLQNKLSPLAFVRRIDVYRTLPVQEYDVDLMQKIRDDQYGLLVFSSPSAFANFYGNYQKKNARLRIVSIGETTTQAILNTTQALVLTSRVPETEGLLYEIKQYFH